MRKDVIVSYDISDDDRLRKVFKIVRGFGDHLQYSVFRCALTDQERVRLMAALEDVLHHTEDQVLFIDLGPVDGTSNQRFSTMGRTIMHPRRYAVVV